jgi:hypothetical protein
VLVNAHGGNYVLSNVVQEANAHGTRMALFPAALEAAQTSLWSRADAGGSYVLGLQPGQAWPGQLPSDARQMTASTSASICRGWKWFPPAAHSATSCTATDDSALRLSVFITDFAGLQDVDGLGQLGDDAPDPGGARVMHGTGQRPGHPHDVTVGLAMSCRFIPFLRCLPE